MVVRPGGEMAYTADSKSAARKGLRVQVSPWAFIFYTPHLADSRGEVSTLAKIVRLNYGVPQNNVLRSRLKIWIILSISKLIKGCHDIASGNQDD